MTKAWASVGSWAGDPCYSVDIDIDSHGGVSYDNDTSFRCLTPKGAWDGAHAISAISDGAGGWIVMVGASRASIQEGFAKARDTEADAQCKPGTLTATNAMRFMASANAQGKLVKVRDIELTYCVPGSSQRRLATP